MQSSKKGIAFYLETVLISLAITLVSVVLVQMLTLSRSTSLQAQRLSTAITLAQNEAESFAASQSVEMQSCAKYYDKQGKAAQQPQADGYTVRVAYEPENKPAGTLYALHITVICKNDIVYELQTEKYSPKTDV